MMLRMQERTTTRPITWLGLALALFGVPLVIYLFQSNAPAGTYTNTFVFAKELSVFATAGLLILLILKGEKLGLDSIGLHSRDWGKSILWGFIGAIIAFAALAVLLFIFSKTGIAFGQGEESKRYDHVSLWALTFMVLRAGIVEEVCYRGYVIERLEKISHHWLVYFIFPLVLFGLFHYKQGLGGIIIATVAGGILAVLYIKRRDLKANIITHFLVDFVPNVLLPILATKH